MVKIRICLRVYYLGFFMTIVLESRHLSPDPTCLGTTGRRGGVGGQLSSSWWEDWSASAGESSVPGSWALVCKLHQHRALLWRLGMRESAGEGALILPDFVI